MMYVHGPSRRQGWRQVCLSLDGPMSSGVSEWGPQLKLFRAIQCPDKRILKDVGILLLYSCMLTHLPHLLQSFPSSSSLYYTFHKTFCVLLITVFGPVIVPFLPLHACVHIAPRYRWPAEVQLVIRCSLLKRCHYSTFSSLPEIKFSKWVQIPSFSCKCTP